MPDYKWPDASKRSSIGKRLSRVDGPLKSSGRAKYSYDIVRPGMLYGKVVRSPYAHARVKSIDTSAAEKMPGVKGVHIVKEVGKEIFWAGDDIVAVAAIDERTAEDAARAIKVDYEVLPHLVIDAQEPKLEEASKPDNTSDGKCAAREDVREATADKGRRKRIDRSSCCAFAEAQGVRSQTC